MNKEEYNGTKGTFSLQPERNNMPANNYDADYCKDMAAVEAYERKRQREQDGPEDIDPEVIAEWEAQDAVDSCGDFPEDGYDDYDEWE